MSKSDNGPKSVKQVELSEAYTALLYRKGIPEEKISGVHAGEYFEPDFPYSKSAWDAVTDIESLSVTIEQGSENPVRTLFRVDLECEYDEFSEKVVLEDSDLAQIAFLLQKSLHRSHSQIKQDQLMPQKTGWKRPYNGPIEWDTVTPSDSDVLNPDLSQGDYYSWYEDERPFTDKYSPAMFFGSFLTFQPFSHWDEMVIHLRYVSGIDGSRGAMIHSDLWLFESHENFREVRIELINPKEYLERLEAQFAESFG